MATGNVDKVPDNKPIYSPTEYYSAGKLFDPEMPSVGNVSNQAGEPNKGILPNKKISWTEIGFGVGLFLGVALAAVGFHFGGDKLLAPGFFGGLITGLIAGNKLDSYANKKLYTEIYPATLYQKDYGF